jgi:hypothetical protein
MVGPLCLTCSPESDYEHEGRELFLLAEMYFTPLNESFGLSLGSKQGTPGIRPPGVWAG